MLLVVLLAAAPLPLDRLPAGAATIEVSLSRECKKQGCPLLLKSADAQLEIADLGLPPGEVKHENGQWAAGDVLFSLRPLQLGQKTSGVLIETLRVPQGGGSAMGSWRVVALVRGALKQVLAFSDADAGLGIGRVEMAEQVLHFTHEGPGDEHSPDKFDDTAWDWSGSEPRKLTGATLFALAVTARPALEEARKVQREVEASCGRANALRTYECGRFESIPQQFFAGKIFLRRAEAQSALEAVRPCAPTAEIFETAFVPP